MKQPAQVRSEFQRALALAKAADARAAALAYAEGKQPRDLHRRELDVARKFLLMALSTSPNRKASA